MKAYEKERLEMLLLAAAICLVQTWMKHPEQKVQNRWKMKKPLNEQNEYKLDHLGIRLSVHIAH